MILLILGGKAIAIFHRFSELLGFRLKAGKSSVGNKIVSLGLPGTFPSRENRSQLLISLTDEKRVKWPALTSRQGMCHAAV